MALGGRGSRSYARSTSRYIKNAGPAYRTVGGINARGSGKSPKRNYYQMRTPGYQSRRDWQYAGAIGRGGGALGRPVYKANSVKHNGATLFRTRGGTYRRSMKFEATSAAKIGKQKLEAKIVKFAVNAQKWLNNPADNYRNSRMVGNAIGFGIIGAGAVGGHYAGKNLGRSVNARLMTPKEIANSAHLNPKDKQKTLARQQKIKSNRIARQRIVTKARTLTSPKIKGTTIKSSQPKGQQAGRRNVRVRRDSRGQYAGSY
jgi:hypothetical protein